MRWGFSPNRCPASRRDHNAERQDMTYQTVNPYTNELVTSYQYATEAEIDSTIEKAHEAFLNWRTTGSGDRSKVLTRAAEPLRADKQGFCLLYTSPSPRDRTRSRMPSS